MLKKDITLVKKIIGISKEEVVEGLLYEHDFTEKQQKIIIKFFNKLLNNLEYEIVFLIKNSKNKPANQQKIKNGFTQIKNGFTQI